MEEGFEMVFVTNSVEMEGGASQLPGKALSFLSLRLYLLCHLTLERRFVETQLL